MTSGGSYQEATFADTTMTIPRVTLRPATFAALLDAQKTATQSVELYHA
jgi:hypothetical protein